MSQKYPGGLITKSPPATVGPVDGEGGSAPGVWTLDQAMALNKQGLWPKPLVLGQLWAWGSGSSGALGLANTTTYSSPKQVGALSDWANVAAWSSFTLAVKSAGTLWSWGSNTSGQLGDGSTIARSSPVQVGALTNWRSVAAGGAGTSLAIKTDGTLWAWGLNNYGQLGLSDVTNRSSPVQVGALTNWLSAACGYQSSIAVKTDGTLWAWGRNDGGQLGLNVSYTVSYSSPKQVGTLTNWRGVTSRGSFCLAVKTDGTLWAWGGGGFGELGLGNTTSYSSPKQVGALTNWQLISAGGQHSLAVKTDGTLWAWGRNFYGTLGLNDTTNRSSPVQVGALTTWQFVSGGDEHSLAKSSLGSIWSWGRNDSGQLGQTLSTATNRSSPVQIGALTTWGKIFAGKANTFATKTP